MAEMTIIGNGHWRELEYAVPEWGVDEENCFTYKGHQYFLSDFMRVTDLDHLEDNPLKGFDGYHSEGFFSGTLIRLHESGDAVQVYRYYS